MSGTQRPADHPAPTTFVAPADLGAVTVTGDDRMDFLDDVLSQRLVDIDVGEVTAALYLDGKGRPLAMADVAVLDEHVVLVTPVSALAGEIAETLGSRTFLADVTFTVLDVTAGSLRGPDSHELATEVGLETPADTVRRVASDQSSEATDDGPQDGLLVVGRDAGIDLLGPGEIVDDAVQRLVGAGARQVGRDTLEAWRIERGIPGWDTEVRAPHLPEEMGLLPTHVHLDAGCYPGQEAVARMWNLGRPRRRLARVHLSGEAWAGWSTGSGRDAVEVTSAAEFDGRRVGLAYVSPRAEPGDRFEGEDADTTVVIRDFVNADRDVPGHNPDVVRGRDKRN